VIVLTAGDATARVDPLAGGQLAWLVVGGA
jgi:hypothetical protein